MKIGNEQINKKELTIFITKNRTNIDNKKQEIYNTKVTEQTNKQTKNENIIKTGFKSQDVKTTDRVVKYLPIL